MKGFSFRRQHVIGHFIADFYCPRLRLIIEVDGGIHDEEGQRAKDIEREEWLVAHGYYVLRLRNEDICKKMDRCLILIHEAINKLKINAKSETF